MKGLSLKFRMMAYSTIMVIIVVSFLASILFYYHNRQVWEEFNLKTASLAAALSHDLELPVLLENRKGIEKMLTGTLKIQDVISISVFNKDAELLVSSGDSSSIPSEYQNIVHSVIEVESDKITEEFMEPVKGEGSEKIGSIEITFSTMKLKNDLTKMISLVIFFTIIMIVLRIISDYFFTAAIIKPLEKLVASSEAIASGDLTQKIGIKRSDEIGKLASSFNYMVKSLKERDDEIKNRQQQIEDNVKTINASLKEKELLLKEIHHRVKNNMQLISSMLKLQSRYIKDRDDKNIFTDCMERIKSMALIHEKLYKSKNMARIDFNIYVRQLARELSRSYAIKNDIITLKIDVENVSLGIDIAIPCGLIINELTSNSLKYAFPEGKKGEINIILRFTAKRNGLELIVSDNGIGLPENMSIYDTDSLGLKLVTTLTKQMNGEMEIFRNGGTKFIITFEEIEYKERVAIKN